MNEDYYTPGTPAYEIDGIAASVLDAVNELRKYLLSCNACSDSEYARAAMQVLKQADAALHECLDNASYEKPSEQDRVIRATRWELVPSSVVTRWVRLVLHTAPHNFVNQRAYVVAYQVARRLEDGSHIYLYDVPSIAACGFTADDAAARTRAWQLMDAAFVVEAHRQNLYVEE